MTISGIRHIRGIGRLRNCTTQGDVTFKKYTLIYGENGRGKTTLGAVLRSLQTQNAAFINGRRTLGSSVDPQVVIELITGLAVFQHGVWTSTASPIDIRIFDAHYIEENIYFGDSITTTQRRNLCRVILGREGVALATRYDEIDKAIATQTTAIRGARVAILPHAGPMPIEQFVALERDPNADQKIQAAAVELEGLREIDNLRAKSGLALIDMPPLPSQLEQILGRTLDDVSRDAELTVRTHVAEHMSAPGNGDWIAEGLSQIVGAACPFCGQSMAGLDLLTAYRTFFNDGYRRLRNDLAQYRAKAARLYSDEALELRRNLIASNTNAAELWARYVPLVQPAPMDFDQIALAAVEFRQEMLAALDSKLAAPLDPVKVSQSYRDARGRYAVVLKDMSAYNQQAITANSEIEEFKSRASATRLPMVERELAMLRATKQRFAPEVHHACAKFATVNAEKTKLEGEKKRIRNHLDQYSRANLGTYQTAINHYLKHFTAGFHIDRVKVEYSGRVPNSTFCIVINDTPVEAGTPDTPIGQPSFRNTLSAGDRSTLALAFFLAELREDPPNAPCVVVFDDPFSSQDQFRRSCTIGEIYRCGDIAAQVVVMSHDHHFLEAIWDLPLPPGERKALQLLASGQRDSVIGEWNIEGETASEDAANRRVVLAFYLKPADADPRSVLQKLRPIAEAHMRRLAPEQLAGVNGLGNMIERARQARSPPSLVECLADLSDIDCYTRRYMHGAQPDHANEQIARDELHGFVTKLLEAVGATPH